MFGGGVLSVFLLRSKKAVSNIVRHFLFLETEMPGDLEEND